MRDSLKLIRLISYPFITFSLTIYLCLYLLSPLTFAYQVSLVAGLVLTLILIYLEKPSWKKIFSDLFNWKSLLLLAPVIFVIFTFGFVLSPLIKISVVDGNEVLGLTALGDYYKHMYVLTSIKTGGLPALHPFFPSSSLSYYYGYYLIPAALSSVFNLDLAHVFFFYLLFTTFIVLFIVTKLCMAFFRSWYQRLLALTLFVFGTGLDIVPTLIQAKSGILTANHIEFWSQTLSLNNYLVNNLYTMLLWVPQHCLPSLIVLVTGIMLLKEKKVPFVWLILAIWFCVISSTFVSISLVIWLGLVFLLVPATRIRLLISGLLAISLLLPYLTELSSRGSILSFGFYMIPFHYLRSLPYWLNCALTFFTEYGLIITAVPIFFALYRKKNKTESTLITLAVLLPIVIGLFVKSSGFNDFSMRSVLPSQMALPFLMAYCLGKIETSLWKKILFLLLVLNFIPSMTGFFYEIHFRLIDRGVIDAPTSSLLINLRKRPIQNLAVLDNQDWVFLIPSYGYQGVYSPRLFDSTGYLSNTGLKEQASYANLVNNLFINETLGKDDLGVLETRLHSFQILNQFFNNYQYLNFILPKYHGTKSAQNPWFKFMELADITGTPITNDYYLFKGEDINVSFSHQKISLDLKYSIKKILDNSNRIYIQRGLWFITGCRKQSSPSLQLEFSDYYTLFDKKLYSDQELCAGVIYYQPKNEKVIISNTSQFDSLYLAPIAINRNPF